DSQSSQHLVLSPCLSGPAHHGPIRAESHAPFRARRPALKMTVGKARPARLSGPRKRPDPSGWGLFCDPASRAGPGSGMTKDIMAAVETSEQAAAAADESGVR